MGIVKGPYDLGDWHTMLLLKSNIRYLQGSQIKFGELAVKKHHKDLGKYLGRVAA